MRGGKPALPLQLFEHRAIASRTVPASSTMGRFTTSTASQATASRSAAKCGVPTAFTRTTISLPFMAARPPWNSFTSCSRAAGLAPSSTASSRSNEMASAALFERLGKKLGARGGDEELATHRWTPAPWRRQR